MPEPPSVPGFWTIPKLAVVAGSLAGLAVVLTLGGPGITVDEPLDVRPGRTYVATLRATGWRFFSPEVVDRVFRDNAEHPPMGRWLLGIASTLGEPLEIVFMGGADPLALYIHAARIAPALAFAVLVGLVVHAAGKRHGPAGGLAAGFALVVMPRVFAHAHLGALDTFLSMFWTLAFLSATRAVERPRTLLAMAGAGVTWGLALLTKIQGWFLAPIVFVWALVRAGPWKAIRGTGAWVIVGLACYFAGWPWLWYQTLERLRGYVGTGVDRASLRVLYFGTVYLDREVPWHYPWFYFAVTVPIGLHAFGAIGLIHAWRARRDDGFGLLLAGSIAMFLLLFSTRVPVYDGERLFLHVFPLWALLVGEGFAVVWQWLAPGRGWRAVLVSVFLAQAYGVVTMHPFGLSYYNGLVLGLRGAERLGLELTYWNDAVDRVLLDRLVLEARPGDMASLAPTLYPGQGLASTTRAMARVPIVLADEDAALRSRFVVVSRRTAYWRSELQNRLAERPPIAVRSRQGVWLSAIWKFSPKPN